MFDLVACVLSKLCTGCTTKRLDQQPISEPPMDTHASCVLAPFFLNPRVCRMESSIFPQLGCANSWCRIKNVSSYMMALGVSVSLVFARLSTLKCTAKYGKQASVTGTYRLDNNSLAVCGFELLLLDIMMQLPESRWSEDVRTAVQ